MQKVLLIQFVTAAGVVASVRGSVKKSARRFRMQIFRLIS